jgi:hypothetical protein
MVRIRLPRRSKQPATSRSSTGSSEPTYNAFISYSHAVDGKLAPALQSALHGFARPWNRLRALRVFRDEASLSANPALWASIERALQASAFFILLASPEAARSRWVDREIAYWLRHKPKTNLLIALTDGEAVWDEAAGDFDWNVRPVARAPRPPKGGHHDVTERQAHGSQPVRVRPGETPGSPVARPPASGEIPGSRRGAAQLASPQHEAKPAASLGIPA